MTQQLLDFDRVHPADKPRLSRQCETILTMLRERPRSNVEFNAVCFRYGARLHELRRAGYRIKSTRVHEGVWKFELLENQG